MAAIALKPVSPEAGLLAGQALARKFGLSESIIAKTSQQAARKVVANEQQLAAEVASTLQENAAILGKTPGIIGPDFQEITRKHLIDAAKFYDTITTTKPSLNALTIAIPGVGVIGSAFGVLLSDPKVNDFNAYSAQAEINFKLLHANRLATQLIPSLTTVTGVLQQQGLTSPFY